MASLLALVSRFPVVGFSGSRECGSVPAVAAAWLSGLLVSSGLASPVFVGCARGVDKAVRLAFPSARVFEVVSSLGRAGFALRSQEFCRAVAAAGGLVVSFPRGACPSSVRPGSAFVGGGSGSWASLAFARELGCAALVCLPSGVAVPAWVGSGSVVGTWFGCRWVFLPEVSAPSLF
ncbi:MAG: hypothetical protein AAGI23_08250 [Bacteroidota bacterium]